jgi:hypothetical protein
LVVGSPESARKYSSAVQLGSDSSVGIATGGDLVDAILVARPSIPSHPERTLHRYSVTLGLDGELGGNVKAGHRLADFLDLEGRTMATKKFLACCLVGSSPLGCLAVFGMTILLQPAIATAEPAEPPGAALPLSVHAGSSDAAPLEEDQGKEAEGNVTGVKSLAVKKAVLAMVKGIRKTDRISNKLIGHLDDAALTAFRQHSGRIADGLERIAEIPDLVVTVVKDKIVLFMTEELKLGAGTARVIGKAIEAVLWTLL